MSEEKPNQKAHISVRFEDARAYLPEGISIKNAGEYIINALQYYHKYLEKKKLKMYDMER